MLKELGLHRINVDEAGDQPESSPNSSGIWNNSWVTPNPPNQYKLKLKSSGSKANSRRQSGDHPLKFKRGLTFASPVYPSGPNHFDKLSDEIIIQIFKWLPKHILSKLGIVSKRFNRLSFDDSFWRRLDLGTKTVPPGVPGLVMARGCVIFRAARATLTSPVFSFGPPSR